MASTQGRADEETNLDLFGIFFESLKNSSCNLYIFTLQDQPKSRKQIVICQALYLACNPAKLILGLVRPSTYHWKASFKKCTRRSKKRKHEGTFCGISWPSFTSLQWPLLHSHTHTNLHTRSWDRLFFLRVIFPNISVMKRRTCFLSQEPTVFHSFLSYTIRMMN